MNPRFFTGHQNNYVNMPLERGKVLAIRDIRMGIMTKLVAILSTAMFAYYAAADTNNDNPAGFLSNCVDPDRAGSIVAESSRV